MRKYAGALSLHSVEYTDSWFSTLNFFPIGRGTNVPLTYNHIIINKNVED